MSSALPASQPPGLLNMAMTPQESAAASGLFILGGLAVWVEYKSPAGMVAALVLLFAQYYFADAE